VIDAQASTGFYSALYGTNTQGAIVALDSDGDTVTFTLKSGPQGGAVHVDADGRFTFHADDRAGTDSFTVTADDGHGGSADHVVSFGVIGTLDASTAAGAINVNLGTGASAGVDASKMPWAINVTGSSFSDLIYGDARANVLIGGTGKDELHGMAGHDYVEGGIGDDKLFGEDGNDRLFGGDGKDALNGGAHNDEMHGGAGNDGFFGGGGNDTIYGDAGDDRIYGDGGDDVIHGGAGNDIMTGAGFNNGGARGANTYVWERADVVNADGSKAGLDHITDFGVGDRLDFSDIVAPSTAVQDAVRITDTAGGLVVAVDMGGTSGFVDVVVLDNVHGLTVEDLTHSGAIAV
jgi:Ca2+-binding RTX toxin-like protein